MGHFSLLGHALPHALPWCGTCIAPMHGMQGHNAHVARRVELLIHLAHGFVPRLAQCVGSLDAFDMSLNAQSTSSESRSFS